MVSLCDVQRSASALGGTAGFRAAFRDDAQPVQTAWQDEPPPPPPPPPALGPRADTTSMSSARAPSLQQVCTGAGVMKQYATDLLQRVCFMPSGLMLSLAR